MKVIYYALVILIFSACDPFSQYELFLPIPEDINVGESQLLLNGQIKENFEISINFANPDNSSIIFSNGNSEQTKMTFGVDMIRPEVRSFDLEGKKEEAMDSAGLVFCFAEQFTLDNEPGQEFKLVPSSSETFEITELDTDAKLVAGYGRAKFKRTKRNSISDVESGFGKFLTVEYVFREIYE